MVCDEFLGQPDEVLCVFGHLVLKAVDLGNASTGAQYHFCMGGMNVGHTEMATEGLVSGEMLEDEVRQVDGTGAVGSGEDVDHRLRADQLAKRFRGDDRATAQLYDFEAVLLGESVNRRAADTHKARGVVDAVTERFNVGGVHVVTCALLRTTANIRGWPDDFRRSDSA